MARAKKTAEETPAEETTAEAQENQTEEPAGDSGDAGEKAPGEPGDVIDARLEQQEQGDDAVENPDEADAGVDESEWDKDAEGEAQHAAVLGAGTGMSHRTGPTQDELNPAYSAPTKSE